MRKKLKLVLLLIIVSGVLHAQKKQYKLFTKLEYGINIGWGHEDVFPLNDPDYSYDVRFYKLQVYYPIKKRQKYSYEILLQPEINIAKHQLRNYFFVTPDENNYIENRLLFTQKRTLTEYVFNIGFLARKSLSNKVDTYLLVSVGPSIISKKSERLAKGFAFSDNFALGVNYKVLKHITFDFRGVIRHVSNADLQMPNGGYNTMNLEIGLRYRR